MVYKINGASTCIKQFGPSAATVTANGKGDLPKILRCDCASRAWSPVSRVRRAGQYIYSICRVLVKFVFLLLLGMPFGLVYIYTHISHVFKTMNDMITLYDVMLNAIFSQAIVSGGLRSNKSSLRVLTWVLMWFPSWFRAVLGTTRRFWFRCGFGVDRCSLAAVTCCHSFVFLEYSHGVWIILNTLNAFI